VQDGGDGPVALSLRSQTRKEHNQPIRTNSEVDGGGGRRGALTGGRPIVPYLSGWRRKRMRGNPLDSPRRPRAPPPKPAKSDAWGEKGSLSSLLPPRWVRIGGRQRKEGGEMMRKEGGRPGRGGAGRASESVVAGGEQRGGAGIETTQRRAGRGGCLSGKLQGAICKKSITPNNSDRRE
jgi:hypothetical protein